MADNEREFRDFISDIRFDDTPDHAHRDRLEEDLRFALAGQPRSRCLSLRICGVITRSKMAKLAAVAVIIIAVLAGVHQIAGPDVALADVLDSVESVQAFMYKIKMTVTGRMIWDEPAWDTEQQGTHPGWER